MRSSWICTTVRRPLPMSVRSVVAPPGVSSPPRASSELTVSFSLIARASSESGTGVNCCAPPGPARQPGLQMHKQMVSTEIPPRLQLLPLDGVVADVGNGLPFALADIGQLALQVRKLLRDLRVLLAVLFQVLLQPLLALVAPPLVHIFVNLLPHLHTVWARSLEFQPAPAAKQAAAKHPRRRAHRICLLVVLVVLARGAGKSARVIALHTKCC